MKRFFKSVGILTMFLFLFVVVMLLVAAALVFSLRQQKPVRLVRSGKMALAAALQALGCVLIIGSVTFVICMAGLHLGRKAGEHLADRASVVGGIILIAIGVEILVKSLL